MKTIIDTLESVIAELRSQNSLGDSRMEIKDLKQQLAKSNKALKDYKAVSGRTYEKNLREAERGRLVITVGSESNDEIISLSRKVASLESDLKIERKTSAIFKEKIDKAYRINCKLNEKLENSISLSDKYRETITKYSRIEDEK